jgi:hypothetical protein
MSLGVSQLVKMQALMPRRDPSSARGVEKTPFFKRNFFSFCVLF